jgi:hypothetical protein
MTTGTLNNFYEWMRLAKFFDMKEAIQKYSINFKKKAIEIQNQLSEATIHNFEEKCINLLLDGFNLGFQTKVVVVIQHIRWKILMFIKNLINDTIQPINKGDISLTHWKDLQLQVKTFGVGAHIFKNMLLSIRSFVSLEYTKIKRSIIAIFNCNSIGLPIHHAYEAKRTLLNVKALTLEHYASNMYYAHPNIIDNYFVHFTILYLMNYTFNFVFVSSNKL